MIEPTTAPIGEWLDPTIHPPPINRKMLLLSFVGVACIGTWFRGDPDGRKPYIAWSPLPKIPASIKAKLY